MSRRQVTKTKTSWAAATGLVAALAVTPAAADPLTNFIDGLFKRETPSQATPEAVEPLAPAAPAPVATPAPARPKPPVAARTAAPKPLPAPSAPAPAPVEAAAPAAPAPAAPAASEQVAALPNVAPLPPRRPADLAAAPVTVASAEPSAPLVQPAAVSRNAPAAIPASPEAAVDRVNAFFNSIELMTANFTQQSGSGQRTEGSLYIKHPGQLRFAYSPPSTLEIVSDGRSVAVRDKKLGTNDVYSVNQTPLKFLMQDQFNLARDTKVQDVQIRPNGIVLIRFEDSATLGGTSKVTLVFDAKANRLREWTVLDAQGFTTSVELSNVNVVQRGTQAASQ